MPHTADVRDMTHMRSMTWTAILACMGISGFLNAMAECGCPCSVIVQADSAGTLAWTTSPPGLTSQLERAWSLDGPWTAVHSSTGGITIASLPPTTTNSTPIFYRASVTTTGSIQGIDYGNVALTSLSTTPSYGKTLRVNIRTNVIINTLDEWSNIWYSSTWNISCCPNPGSIDSVFDPATQMLVATFSGVRENACYSTVITNVTQCHDQLLVQYCETMPGPTCSCFDTITYPSHVIRVPRSTMPVCFIQSIVTNNCP